MPEHESRSDELNLHPTEKAAPEPVHELVPKPDYPRDFYIKEVDMLREKISSERQESRTVERNVVIAIGAYWAFLIKGTGEWHLSVAGIQAAWTIPIIFALLGAIRCASLGARYMSMDKYLLKIETYFLKDADGSALPEGWQNFHERNRPAITGSAFIFWAVLLVVTVVAAYYGPKR